MIDVERSIPRRLVLGGRGGLAATAIMTGVFAALDAAGWLGQLPPDRSSTGSSRHRTTGERT